MNNETELMRQLAQAIDDLEDMVEFMSDSPDEAPSHVQIRWNLGCATRGYDQLNGAMARLISQRWKQLRDEAISAQSEEVERLRLELAKHSLYTRRPSGGVA